MSITLPGGRGEFVGDAVLVVGFVDFGLAGRFVGTVTKKHNLIK